MRITNEYQMNSAPRKAGSGMDRRDVSTVVQASMSQVEMTVWLCIMAVLSCGMLAILGTVAH